jgi:hypothetical protein
VADAERFLSRAAKARRSSKRVALKDGFDAGADGDWLELIRDMAALANSGRGVVVLDGVGDLDEELLHERLERYVEPEFEPFTVVPISRGGRPATAIVVEGAANPLVFTRQGRSGDRIAFGRGGVYFQLDATRTQWLRNIRAVMQAPGGAEVAVIETAERDEEGRPKLIRLTTDPHAPLYGQIDPDQSHPCRQKEVIAEVNARLDGTTVNAFDVLSVRRVHSITEQSRPEFVHVPKFGSPQYSDAFVDWLVGEFEREPQFFARAKKAYLATRPRRRAGDSTS